MTGVPKTATTNTSATNSGKQKSRKRKQTAVDKDAGKRPGKLAFDLLLNALPHSVLVVDIEGAIIYANAAAEWFFQASVATLNRQNLSQIVAFGSPLLALVEQVRRTGSSVNEYSVDLGTPKLAKSTLVDIYGSRLPEQPELIVLMLQQRSMAQMIERQFTHRAAARSVSGMASVLAHEIKNPLSGIKGAAQLLETTASDDDRSLTQLICTETDRIRDLVDDMEVFGDERPLYKEPINIHDVLNHVKQLTAHGVANGIDMLENYDPSLPLVPGNRGQLIQALLNLVKNAAEAIAGGQARDRAERGFIRLTTAFRPGVWLSVPGTGERVSLPLMISVEDNGPGISQSMKSHLFDPFVTSKAAGKGLGLALVAKIIRDHGGIIECSTSSKRTVFRILLPMHATAPGGDE